MNAWFDKVTQKGYSEVYTDTRWDATSLYWEIVIHGKTPATNEPNG
jgi:hypothetical protein